MNNVFISYVVTILVLINSSLSAQEKEVLVTFPDGETYACFLADSLFERSAGLRYHNSLEKGTGMLFVYPKPSLTSFWMPPDMKFDLDMIFLNQNGEIVHLVHSAKPCKDKNGFDCESHSPPFPVSYVLEIPAGDIKKLGLENGEPLSFVFTNR
jgi:uncharacterized membrane protein (UPF0127 family)